MSINTEKFTGALYGMALLTLSSGPTLATETSHILTCEQQETMTEGAALKRAPLGARRLSPHVLAVATKKATRKFVDKPPHDEGGMAGVHWRYCGFDPFAKAHLVERADYALSSGSLLFEDTGVLLRAGHTVVFAQDHKAFLAIEQQDGVDGALWSVYDNSGRPLWKGYAGTTQKIDGVDQVTSTFDRPQWNNQGRLTAHFACTASAISGTVTLLPATKNWRWQGHTNC